MTEPFAARITETGVETNRRDGELSREDLEQIDKLRQIARIVEKHGCSAVGLRVKVIPA